MVFLYSVLRFGSFLSREPHHSGRLRGANPTGVKKPDTNFSSPYGVGWHLFTSVLCPHRMSRTGRLLPSLEQNSTAAPTLVA